MVHGLETLLKLNEEATNRRIKKLGTVRRVCCVLNDEKDVVWVKTCYGYSMAESARRCAISYALSRSQFPNGQTIEVVVKPEDPLPVQYFKIRLEATATWVNPREGCGDDLERQDKTASA